MHRVRHEAIAAGEGVGAAAIVDPAVGERGGHHFHDPGGGVLVILAAGPGDQVVARVVQAVARHLLQAHRQPVGDLGSEPHNAQVLVHQVVGEEVHQPLRVQAGAVAAAFVEQVHDRPASVRVVAHREPGMAVDQALLRQVGPDARDQGDRCVHLVQLLRGQQRGTRGLGHLVRGHLHLLAGVARACRPRQREDEDEEHRECAHRPLTRRSDGCGCAVGRRRWR